MIKRRLFVICLILVLTMNLSIETPADAANNAAFYFNNGVNYHKQGQIELAIQNYKKALSLDPKMADARYNLCIAYQKLAVKHYNGKNYNMAIQNYKNALTIEPKNAEIYHNLGVIYSIIGQTDLSIANYQKAAGLNPKFSGASKNLAVSYYNKAIDSSNRGDLNQAIVNHNKAISINPQYIYAYEALARIYTDLGQTDQAIANYEKALDIDPNDALNYYNLGVSYMLKNQQDKAIQCYQKALKLEPDMEEAQINLNILMKDKRNLAIAAKIDTAKAVQKAPERIYKMVSLERGLKYTSMMRMYEILDLIWSDPEGQKLLDIACRNNIPIKITPGRAVTNAVTQTRTYKQSITFAGIPIMTFNAGSDKTTSINIGENYVQSLRDQSLPVNHRVESIETVVHELCHAVRTTLSANMNNALEEELTASMIGFNIAYRVITDRGLNEEETSDYSKSCLIGMFSDDHRSLPTYNGFNNFIQNIGIYPPYLHIYQNINALYNSIPPEYKNVQNMR